MQAIYEPKGRAREYAPLACNLYRGCSHGCTYCYAPSVLHMPREEFHGNPQPRKGIIGAVARNAEKLAVKGAQRPVLLCFTTDPYQPINDMHGLTRQAISVLNEFGFPVHILTKRGMAAEDDFDVLSRNPLNAFGMTLTCATGDESTKWEPHADPPERRLFSLRRAHARGIKTFVSLEPVLDPAIAFLLIAVSKNFVDEYRIGKWNYDKRANEIDWPAFRERVVEKLEEYGKKYLIKKDLLEAK